MIDSEIQKLLQMRVIKDLFPVPGQFISGEFHMILNLKELSNYINTISSWTHMKLQNI